jgi:hypothetical protein
MAYTNIDLPTDYFNTIIWSGASNASGRSFTGVGFKPDWVWQKVRTTTYGDQIFDIIRGSGKRLVSSNTNAEELNSQYGYLTTFDTDGFTTVPGSTDNTGWNEVGQTYVAWNWLAANTTTSNTSGTITSTVSANTTAGFSIVSYTGTGNAGATVGHGLGATPAMFIIKNRVDSITSFWCVYHKSAFVSQANPNILYLNSTGAESDDVNVLGNTTVTINSNVFSLGDYNGSNGSGDAMIAYCFAEIKGYSKFGSYTGNGSADGTFVYTGFKPAWIMVKETGNVNSWRILDNKRSTFNVVNKVLLANSTNAEGSADHETDFVSNGFKLRSSDTNMNRSGGKFIYMAFAENPFVTSGGIPVTAR